MQFFILLKFIANLVHRCKSYSGRNENKVKILFLICLLLQMALFILNILESSSIAVLDQHRRCLTLEFKGKLLDQMKGSSGKNVENFFQRFFQTAVNKKQFVYSEVRF